MSHNNDRRLLRRRIAGAVLLDLAVSPLFVWNVFAQPIARQIGATSTQTSLVFSVALVAFSVGVIAGGRLADVMAPRRLAVISAIGMLTGLGLSAGVSSLWLIVLGFGCLQGLAAGLGYATAVHEAGLINRGLIMALVVSAYGAGSAALAPPVAWIVEHHGYASAFAMLAVLSTGICVLAALLLPGSPPASAQHTPAENSDSPAGQRRLITLLWLMFGLASAPGLAAFAIAGQISGGAAAGAVAAVSLGNLGGRLLAGPMTDHLGMRPTLHGFFLLLVVASALLIGVDSYWLIWAILLAVGTHYGALSTLTPLATRAGVPAHSFGRAFGLVFSAWGLFGLAAPAAGAALIAHGERPFVAAAMLACGLSSWLVAVAVLRQLRIAQPRA